MLYTVYHIIQSSERFKETGNGGFCGFKILKSVIKIFIISKIPRGVKQTFVLQKYASMEKYRKVCLTPLNYSRQSSVSLHDVQIHET